MKLFIRLVDGQPFEHPIIESNFKQAFPNEDTENLSENFAYFTRLQQPLSGPYEEFTGVEYISDGNGGFKDNFVFRQFSAEEIAAKQQQTKDEWAASGGYASWVFDETTCRFDAPVPYPTDGLKYVWDEPTLNWITLG
jgi:hypothetical protein